MAEQVTHDELVRACAVVSQAEPRDRQGAVDRAAYQLGRAVAAGELDAGAVVESLLDASGLRGTAAEAHARRLAGRSLDRAAMRARRGESPEVAAESGPAPALRLVAANDGAEREAIQAEGCARTIPPTPSALVRATIGRPEYHVPTGIASLDRATRGGPIAGRVMVIGGAPDAGKTSLQVQIVVHAARRGHPSMLLAVDEDPMGLLYRVGQSLGGLALEDLERDVPGAREALARLLDDEVPLLRVVDGSEATVEEAAEQLESLARNAPADRPPVFGLDSLQTARVRGVSPVASHRERVDAVTGALRGLARRGWLPIATSELSRAAYRSRDVRERIDPLAAFKESGSIEYAAGLALVLSSVEDEALLVDVTIAKNKRGSREPFRLERSPSRATYREVAIAPDRDDDERASEVYAATVGKVLQVIRGTRGLVSANDVVRAMKEAHMGSRRKAVQEAYRELLEQGRIGLIDGGLRITEKVTHEDE
jgi:hypothetical protein